LIVLQCFCCIEYALIGRVCKTFTLAEFHSHHDVRRVIHRRDSISHLTSYRGSVMEEDRRLAMFSWNLETLNMIVLPMVYHKYVLTSQPPFPQIDIIEASSRVCVHCQLILSSSNLSHLLSDRCPAVAEMRDHLATIDVGRKVGGCSAPFVGIGEGRKPKQLHCTSTDVECPVIASSMITLRGKRSVQ